jgi:hypothetical protein
MGILGFGFGHGHIEGIAQLLFETVGAFSLFLQGKNAMQSEFKAQCADDHGRVPVTSQVCSKNERHGFPPSRE